MSKQDARSDMRMLLTLANTVNPGDQVEEAVEDLFRSHLLSGDEAKAVDDLSDGFIQLCKVVIDLVPPSADRTAVIRMLADAKMVAVRAVALRGRF